jgi:hypothetical protein
MSLLSTDAAGSRSGSPKGAGGRSSSMSSLFDTETHVGGKLTFVGRTKEVRFFFFTIYSLGLLFFVFSFLSNETMLTFFFNFLIL